jgi:hypothetical protein
VSTNKSAGSEKSYIGSAEKREKDRIRKQQSRLKNSNPEKEREYNARSRAKSRLDINYRDNERRQDAAYHNLKRQDPLFRERERDSDSAYHQHRRLDPEFRENERDLDTAYRQQRRLDPEFRERERERDQKYHQIKRQFNVNFRIKERLKDRENKWRVRNSQSEILKTFQKGIEEEPTNCCSSCGGLFFEKTVRRLTPAIRQTIITRQQDYERDYPLALEQILNKKVLEYRQQVENRPDPMLFLCLTCYKYVCASKMPPLCLNSGLEFPDIVPCLEQLNTLEEQIVSPRIAFLCLRPLDWDAQMGLRGNVVNVPVDVEETITALPRKSFAECKMINIKFMRRMHYNKAYIHETIRPKHITEALNFLSKSKVYKELKINVNNPWNDATDDELEFNDDNDEIKKPKTEDTSDESSLDEEYFAENEFRQNPQIHETMLLDHNKNDANVEQLLKETRIAPGENRAPISLIHDPIAEEATFLKIFCGNLLPEQSANISLQNRCKSFFRRFDRRCASNIRYIFYMYKKLISIKLSMAISMAVKKVKISNLTVRDILENTEVFSAIKQTEDYKSFMREIRSSPEYWLNKKKTLFAMIRQLGQPTLFLTMAPAEIDWPELLNILIKLNKKNTTIDQMTRKEKIDLIASDPVTTARYYDNRNSELMKYVLNKNAGPFCEHPIVDHYYRIEFQGRGSPHNHGLYWLENAPGPYDITASKKSVEYENIINFIDKYITCELPISSGGASLDEISFNLFSSQENDNNDNPNEIQNNQALDENRLIRQFDIEQYDVLNKISTYQRHRHKHNCQVDQPIYEEEDGKRVSLCKYGFPRPILNETMILDPLLPRHARGVHENWIEDEEEEDVSSQMKDSFERARKNYYRIRKVLNKLAYTQEEWIRTKSLKDDDKLKKHNHPDLFLGDLLEKLNLDYDDYILALRSNIKRSTVFLKRTCHEIMINNYNRDILERNNGNMDIQYILHPYDVSSYVYSYLNKGDKEMSQLLKMIADELADKRRHPNMDLKAKMRKLSNKFQNCSEISVQECIFSLLSMQVSHCSREQTFILSFRKKDRFAHIKPKEFLENMQEDSSNVYLDSMIDRYPSRPDSLADICLAEFISKYNYITLDKYKTMLNPYHISEKENNPYFQGDLDGVNDDDNEEFVIEQENANVEAAQQENLDPLRKRANRHALIALKGHKGYIQERPTHKIIRYVKYNIQTQEYDYYREHLMLFCPWINEERDVEIAKELIKARFLQKADIIAKNKRNFVHPFSELTDEEALEQLLKQIETHERGQEEIARRVRERNVVDDMLIDELEAGEGENDEFELLEEQHGYHADVDAQVPGLFARAAGNNLESRQAYQANRLMNDKQLSENLCKLNQGQQIFLKEIVRLTKRQETFHVFLTAPGGAGKSFLVNVLREYLHKYYNDNIGYVSMDANCNPYIIMSAYIGKAAFGIRGDTLHRIFHLNFKEKSDAFKNLDEDTANLYRKSFENLKLLIIDEISTVSSNLFHKIDQRLRQLIPKKDENGKKIIVKENGKADRCLLNDKFLGGISSLCSGDFFQLKPINESYIYKTPRSAQNAYLGCIPGEVNPAWAHFKIYELTEIMRQRGDKAFSEALFTLGRYGMMALSDEQIALFDSRIDPDYEENAPKEAIGLFGVNDLVHKYNKKKLNKNKKDFPIFMNMAKDVAKAPDNDPKMIKQAERYHKLHVPLLPLEKTNMQPNSLPLKIGAKYMIIYNINVPDGLANGTTGILKEIIKTADGKYAEVLVFDFIDRNVGVLKRGEEKEFFNKNPQINKDDTPLRPTIAKLHPLVEKPKWYFERTQYQIYPAEAITIHKSQGQTITTGVTFDLKQKELWNAHYYVAWSRCETLNSLYLYGARSIVEGKSFVNWSAKKRAEKIEQHKATSSAWIEMTRMRNEAPFDTNTYYFMHNQYIDPSQVEENFVYKSEFNRFNSLGIACVNVAGLSNAHKTHIQSDWGLMNADILIFVECHSNCSNKNKSREEIFVDYDLQSYLEIKPKRVRSTNQTDANQDNFKLVYLSGGKKNGTKIGTACYIRNEYKSKLQFLNDNSPADGLYAESSNLAELSLFKFDYKSNADERSDSTIFICSVYKHPEKKFKLFFLELIKFLIDSDLARETTSANTQSSNILSSILATFSDKKIEISKNLVIVGDFNYDINIEKKKEKFEKLFLSNMQLKMALKREPSTNNNTQIDLCLVSNSIFEKLKYNCLYYENYFSDHKTIWLSMSIFSKQLLPNPLLAQAKPINRTGTSRLPNVIPNTFFTQEIGSFTIKFVHGELIEQNVDLIVLPIKKELKIAGSLYFSLLDFI